MKERRQGRPAAGRGTRSRRKSWLALSTGRAARYCYVTADTILNWINNGAIKAQRTAGGQYRILVTDLRTFMKDHGMDTRLIDSEADVRPHCWEFHCRGRTDAVCMDCIARRSGAIDCYELSGVNPPDTRLNPDCEICDYHRLYAGSAGQEE